MAERPSNKMNAANDQHSCTDTGIIILSLELSQEQKQTSNMNMLQTLGDQITSSLKLSRTAPKYQNPFLSIY